MFRDQGGKWTQTAELMSSHGGKFEYFGFSVAVSGDGSTVLVGAIGHNYATGAAYVFADQGAKWTQVAVLTASDGTFQDYFGFSVAVSADGSTAVIGTFQQGGRDGAAYVFSDLGGTWTQVAELTASDGAAIDGFGLSVAVSSDGSTVVVGARGHDYTGAAYVFGDQSGKWTQTTELTASGGAVGDELGMSVAVSSDGSTVLVGAPDGMNLKGAAYLFGDKTGEWTQTRELTASHGAAGDYFGGSVALTADDSTAVVGAPSAKRSHIRTGSAYVFKP